MVLRGVRLDIGPDEVADDDDEGRTRPETVDGVDDSLERPARVDVTEPDAGPTTWVSVKCMNRRSSRIAVLLPTCRANRPTT